MQSFKLTPDPLPEQLRIAAVQLKAEEDAYCWAVIVHDRLAKLVVLKNTIQLLIVVPTIPPPSGLLVEALKSAYQLLPILGVVSEESTTANGQVFWVPREVYTNLCSYDEVEQWNTLNSIFAHFGRHALETMMGVQTTPELSSRERE